jgi:predicted Rossmann-fold nucleotide-binding protein
MGQQFWRPLGDFLREQMLAEGMIDEGDLARVVLTDSPDEAMASITDSAARLLQRTWLGRTRRHGVLLGERR